MGRSQKLIEEIKPRFLIFHTRVEMFTKFGLVSPGVKASSLAILSSQPLPLMPNKVAEIDSHFLQMQEYGT